MAGWISVLYSEFLEWVHRVQKASDAGVLPPKRTPEQDRDLQKSFWPPALTPQEWELIGTVAGSEGASKIKGSLPVELLETMVATFLSSSPELLKHYEAADQATRSRLSAWIKYSVLELWGRPHTLGF